MSFISAIWDGLKGIGRGIDKATDVISPYASVVSLIPGIGGPFGLIWNLVTQAELLVSTDSSGAQKKAAVTSFVKLKYPKLPESVISNEIDVIVGSLNRLAAAVEASTPPNTPTPTQ